MGEIVLDLAADAPADSPARILRDWLLTDEGRALPEAENYVWARTGLPAQSAGAGNPFDVPAGDAAKEISTTTDAQPVADATADVQPKPTEQPAPAAGAPVPRE